MEYRTTAYRRNGRNELVSFMEKEFSDLKSAEHLGQHLGCLILVCRVEVYHDKNLVALWDRECPLPQMRNRWQRLTLESMLVLSDLKNRVIENMKTESE